jgi:sulfide:quinone oxidoreductase
MKDYQRFCCGPGIALHTGLGNAVKTINQREHQILIVGGGAAGLTVAHLLLRLRPGLDVALLEPSPDHYYQPGWTLVGGGLFQLSQTRRDQGTLIPAGCTWIQAAATGFDPEHNLVRTSADATIGYQVLVMAAGLQCRWERIEGLTDALGSHGVCSNYSKDFAPYTWETIQNFKGGTAIFTVPETPIKCGGAPLKALFMADDCFKAKSGVGVNSRVILATAGSSLFAVPAYARVIKKVIQRRGIEVRLHCNLQQVHAKEQLAVFAVTDSDGGVSHQEIGFDMLHAVPPMTAPEVVQASPLAGEEPGGWVAADQLTTQHPQYANIFALGDVSGLPTSRTAGAVRGEAPVTAANVLAYLDGLPLKAHYDGYTVCPLITGYGSVVMAEFDYTQKPVSSFLVDPTKERWSMWLMKTRLLPWLYWNRMIKGFPHEGAFLKPWAPLIHLLRLDYREPSGSSDDPAGPAGSC